MAHTELKNKIWDRQSITEALGTNVHRETFVKAILNSPVFKSDLNESNVTADVVLNDRMLQTVGAVKLC